MSVDCDLYFPIGTPHLAMTRPEISSRTAALTRTAPTLVCERLTFFEVLAITTNVVPSEVVDSAAPMMNVSTGPVLGVNYQINLM